jgi:hypothetical protein
MNSAIRKWISATCCACLARTIVLRSKGFTIAESVPEICWLSRITVEPMFYSCPEIIVVCGNKTSLVRMSGVSLQSGSFEELAMPLFDQLYNFAHWLTQNRDEAEDLVQETYAKALKGFSSFPMGTNFRAWMYRILRNRFWNKLQALSLSTMCASTTFLSSSSRKRPCEPG